VDSAAFGGLALPRNEARCSNKLPEHLEHLPETNDLFGNVAKSQNLKQMNVSGILVPKEQIGLNETAAARHRTPRDTG
jgi:hypothetical protein